MGLFRYADHSTRVWLTTQKWVVNGKPSDELRDAMQKMPLGQRMVVNQMLRRSMLADLFKLKTHVETRQMQYFELVPAKGGLKIKEVPALETPPDETPAMKSLPGGGIQAGAFVLHPKEGRFVLRAHGTTMRRLTDAVMGLPEPGGRPMVDKIGFKGSFDVEDMPFPIVSSDAAQQPSPMDAASIFTGFEETLGVKLVAVKGPVEVLVIDSIEEPREN